MHRRAAAVGELQIEHVGKIKSALFEAKVVLRAAQA
jgi:hypothetical protein